MPIPSLHIVILAAGMGKRMCSTLPKVLHPLAGKPMLMHVLEVARALHPKDIWIVCGHEAAQLQRMVQGEDIHWVEQKEQRGSGHALQVACQHMLAFTAADDDVLVISADSPALTLATLEKMRVAAKTASLVLLNILLENPFGFGRIVRDANRCITRIVEEKDADEKTRAIQEVYSGILLVKWQVLTRELSKLTADNAQKEYYLTQLIELCVTAKDALAHVLAEDSFEARGINDRVQLAEMERYMQDKKAKVLMQQGVTLLDPARIDMRGTLTAAQDVTIDINCIFEGEVVLESGTKIGANCILKNCRLGKNVTVHPYTLIDGAEIFDHVTVGPFARVRPGTVLEAHAQVGNFVEVKKTRLGEYSKASHLSYLGDAEIGAHVNVGAGTITCNYDGANKHTTIIEEGAFIGSNTSLVAPVTIEKNATIGAGSVITRAAPADTLSVARAKQVTLPGWKRPKKG